ncbi:hypothetical protein QBC43DRAFT_356709 [Cladorrhinum sp. PSN259]|nr:hypothetical protein QBC43DRAFT_356709 [Cladorrhinum sp. PSN259]
MYSNTPPPSTLTSGSPGAAVQMADHNAPMAEHKCKCGVKTASKNALKEHWEEEYNKGNKHFHCGICMEFFYTPDAMIAHDRRASVHKVKQQVACPGCDAQFNSPGGLINHIERNLCTKIGSQAMAERREEKLAFARELQRRHFGMDPGKPEYALKIHRVGTVEEKSQVPFNFSRFVSSTVDGEYGNPSLSSFRPTASSTVRPNPLSFQTIQTEFPQLGARSDVPVPDVPTESSGNPWGQKKNLFPDAQPPIPPTADQLRSIQEPAKTKETAWPEHHPLNPKWNPSLYYVPVLDKYRCPIDRCPKSFSSSTGLGNHLQSAAHTNNWKVQCPMCMRWFDTTAALIQHAESQSVRCNLRKSEGFRHLLSQATGGMIDSTEKNADGTEKYQVTEEARKEWRSGPVSDLGSPVNAMGLGKENAVAESKNKLKSFDDDELKEPTLDW